MSGVHGVFFSTNSVNEFLDIFRLTTNQPDNHRPIVVFGVTWQDSFNFVLIDSDLV